MCLSRPHPISIIIPVYNAELYVREAVVSALAEPETGEVILVEDGSTDGSAAVCEQLAASCEKVRLYRHPDKQNKGAGASRNLGIRNASCPHIAFLDADDYFLPGRFKAAKEIMTNDPTMDGVCEAVGTKFESAEAKERYLRQGKEELTTMHVCAEPAELFFQMAPVGSGGFFHTAGWTIKKSAAEKAGLFDEHLRLHQDTIFFHKVAAVCRIKQGSMDQPVAMRRVHNANRITMQRSLAERYRARRLAFEALYAWCKRSAGDKEQKATLDLLVREVAKPPLKNPSELRFRFSSFSLLIRYAFRNPDVATTAEYRKILRSCFEEKPGQWMTLYEWGWLVKDAFRRSRS
jgi:glycosyltransferase involved in cell wall biosynthesis